MSEIINPRDILLQGAPTRMVPVTLPPNVIIPAIEELKPNALKPPAPTGLSVVGALYDLLIRTAPPIFPQGHGYSHTKVYMKIWYGGDLPTFPEAELVSSFIGQVGSVTVGPTINARIWVTWVSRDGVESDPAGGFNGAVAQTPEDADRLVGALTGPGKPFTIVNEPTTLSDGTVVPAGTYTSAAFMQRFVAARGNIGLLAVDDARISSLTATKLVSGTVQVGVHIGSSNYVGGQQGWAINGQGGAEFNNVNVRGGIYATYGQIGGCTITGGGIYSPNFSEYAGWGFDVNGNAQFNQIKIRGAIMGGSFNDYAWPAGGATGFYLGPAGLLLGNGNIGRYVQITSEGNFYAPGFSIVNGSMTIYQANVISTLNLAGYSVIVPFFSGYNGNQDVNQPSYGTPNSSTSGQILVAGSSLIAIVNWTAYLQGFHGFGCRVVVKDNLGNIWDVTSQGSSGENYVSGCVAGFFTAPHEAYYYISAFVTGEAGTICTGATVTGLGGKR